MLDVAIVGGGIAGCYAAHRLRQIHPEARILIIEACSRMGGRAKTDTFGGITVPTGAGVGRLRKDKLLQRLMQDVHLPIQTFPTGHHSTGCEGAGGDIRGLVAREFTRLRRAYEREAPVPAMTFEQFARPRMDDYSTFIACVGYSDFESADVKDVFLHYSFADNYRTWTGFAVPWSAMMAAMVRDVPCITRTRVTKLTRRRNGTFRIRCDDDAVLHARNVIVATDVAALQRLLPAYVRVYRHIHGQPFLKIYGAFTPAGAEAMTSVVCKHGVTVLPGSPLQKIIHMKDNVYMIAFSDNENATALRPYMENNDANRAVLVELLERALELEPGVLHMTGIRSYFWTSGTHYYDPLHEPYVSRQQFLFRAQRPTPGVFVVGECVALQQGWVEGALQTVENVLTEQYIA